MANPDKTQLRGIIQTWRIPPPPPNYLGVPLDRTMSYKQHIHNTKMKVATRNTLLKKLSNSNWGCNASTNRTTSLALSYSTAEYACRVWARSLHAFKLDPELNDACKSIAGCLSPTNIEELYLFAGIAPPDIRRDVCDRVEKKKQETNTAHSLHGEVPAERHLKRNASLAPYDRAVNLGESLAKGHTSPWTAWRCLNRSRTGVACSNEQRKRWKYFNGDTTCECVWSGSWNHQSYVTIPITRTSLHFGSPSEVQRKCQKMCKQMEEYGLMARKKKTHILLRWVLLLFVEVCVRVLRCVNMCAVCEFWVYGKTQNRWMRYHG